MKRENHWAYNPEMKKKVMEKISKTQFKKGMKVIPWNKGKTGVNCGVKKGTKNPKHSLWMKVNSKLPDMLRGKTIEQIYGKEKANTIREKMAKKKYGMAPWNKGTKGLMPPAKNTFKKGIENINFGRKTPTMKGKTHYNWKGGITPEIMKIRNSTLSHVWRTMVFERDNYTCQECGLRGVYLHAHHIREFSKFPELRFVLSNGLTLCKSCHINLHKKNKNPVEIKMLNGVR